MYKVNKVLNIVFCTLIFLISISMMFANLEILIDNEVATEFFKKIVELGEDNSIEFICTFGVLILLCIINITTINSGEEKLKTGVAIQAEKGMVYISKDTIESIVSNVLLNYKEFVNVKTNIVINERGIKANIFTYIIPDTVLPNVTSKVQELIKDTVLKQTTVKLEEVNIKVKGVYNNESDKS